MDSVSIPSAGMFPLPSVADYLQAPSTAMRPTTKEGHSFSDILQKAMLPPGVDVKFSLHARKRMESRGIKFNTEDFIKMDEGINRAKDKGSKESLILMNGNAYVVNVENRTVITAMNQKEMQGGIFTQIDSTVIL